MVKHKYYMNRLHFVANIVITRMKNTLKCWYNIKNDNYREQVRVNGFGLFLLILYPGAYVDLSTEHLQIVSPLRQLRIYCAGVWHNFIIVVVAWAVLLGLPIMLVPFYSAGSGVAITQVKQVCISCFYEKFCATCKVSINVVIFAGGKFRKICCQDIWG